MNIKWQKPEASEPKAVTFGELEVGEAFMICVDLCGDFRDLPVLIKGGPSQAWVLDTGCKVRMSPTEIIRRVTVNAEAWPTEMMQ